MAGNSRKTGKEQYYTKSEIAKFCTDIALKYVDNFIVEPAAGTGEFLKLFGNDSIGFDIEPKGPGIEEKSWFDVKDLKDFSVITNPPFGRMNSLSVKFFNHSAKLGAKYICFLIPISWRKWSTQNRLDNRYHLVEDVDLPDDILFYGDDVDPNKKNILKCIFQVWERRDEVREKKIYSHKDLVSCKPDVADIQVVQQGWSCGQVNLDFDRSKNVNGCNYYKASKEIIETLSMFYNENYYAEFKKNSAYVDSISYSEISYLLWQEIN